MPKSGGSTMNAILHVLADWNKFRFVKFEPQYDQFGHFYEGGKLSHAIAKIQQKSVSFELFLVEVLTLQILYNNVLLCSGESK